MAGSPVCVIGRMPFEQGRLTPNVTPSLCNTPWGCLVLASNHGDSHLFPSALPRPKRPSRALMSEMRQRWSLPNRQSFERKQLEKRIAQKREQLYRDVSLFVKSVMRDVIFWVDVVQERYDYLLLLDWANASDVHGTSMMASDATASIITVDDTFDNRLMDGRGIVERDRPVALAIVLTIFTS